MNAYDRCYLEQARNSLGRMLDYAVYELKYDLEVFWQMFLASPVAKQFEYGWVSILAGRSGVELALMVTGQDGEYAEPHFAQWKSEEYWTGWALAYYQWKSGMSFVQITELVPIGEIRMLYAPYHEMDIRQFCDRMNEMFNARKQVTNLKRKRLAVGLSQSALAGNTGIPVRTIQQYEQGQKNINKARAEYLIALARALYCAPEELLERPGNVDTAEREMTI